jgi:hypothetical protein
MKSLKLQYGIKFLNFSLIRKPRNIFFLVILTLIGVGLHFYNLNWGAPFYFHPDERNIASSVSQLQFPDQMNPHFFAYGSLPIYVIYFTGIFTNYITNPLTTNHQLLITTFDQAILISRFYSALFATLLIPLLFVIARSIATKQSQNEKGNLVGLPRFLSVAHNDGVGLIAAFLATTSVGFIQFAHFGTFEMWLTFFSVLLFWVCIQKSSKKNILLIGIIFGILVATKVSSLVLFPLLLFVIPAKEGIEKFKNKYVMTVLKTVVKLIIVCITAAFMYYLTNPFVILDTQSFKNSMHYESGVVLGTELVFYTGEFFNSIPVLFQFTNIYPFLLNPLITFIFILSFIYLLYKTIKTKNLLYITLSLFFLILFLSQAFLFAKWTRYMMPTLPFVYLIIAIAFPHFLKSKRQQFNNVAMITIIITSSIFSIAYFITAFVHPDTRIEAYHAAQKIILPDAPILSEVYDLGMIHFNQTFSNMSFFNFYELDNNSPEATPDLLQQQISQNSYIILPSQRLIKPRMINKEKFPQGHSFYSKLLSNKLGFKKIYETPCDLFCKITYLGDPIFRFEQTASVFDRPTFLIFKKK